MGRMAWHRLTIKAMRCLDDAAYEGDTRVELKDDGCICIVGSDGSRFHPQHLRDARLLAKQLLFVCDEVERRNSEDNWEHPE